MAQFCWSVYNYINWGSDDITVSIWSTTPTIKKKFYTLPTYMCLCLCFKTKIKSRIIIIFFFFYMAWILMNIIKAFWMLHYIIKDSETPMSLSESLTLFVRGGVLQEPPPPPSVFFTLILVVWGLEIWNFMTF